MNESKSPRKNESGLVKGILIVEAAIVTVPSFLIGAALGATYGTVFSALEGEDLIRTSFIDDTHPRNHLAQRTSNISYITGRTLGQLTIAGWMTYGVFFAPDTGGI